MDPFAKGKIANMHAEISQAYQDIGMLAEAVGELEKAVTLCPTFADLRTRLGVLYRDAGDVGRALEQFEGAKAANPKFVHARVMLGVLLLTSGAVDRAIDEWLEVVELDPDNKSAQMYIRVAKAQRDKTSMPPTLTTHPTLTHRAVTYSAVTQHGAFLLVRVE